MKMTFIGAAHEVTGSCHLIELNGKKVNLHVAVAEDYVAIGTPIIFGGF